MHLRLIIGTAVLALSGYANVVALPAQTPLPKVLHAQVTTKACAGKLERVLAEELARQEVTWLAYDIPVVTQSSSGWRSSEIVLLEGAAEWQKSNSQAPAPASFDHALLLLRLSQGSVSKVRLEAPDQQFDAGGTRFVWLSDVSPDESVRVLARMIAGRPGVKDENPVLFAISQHATPLATKALIEGTSPDRDFAPRKAAAFWLASARGRDGLLAVEHLTRTDADAAFRKELTFDLTLPSDPEGLKELIRLAHEDPSTEVRKQAQFWMATKGGAKVSANLRQAAESDENKEVRQAAVFSITRLPQEEATTQLIALAKTASHPEVRKQAVFWLGQSDDPRALQYLTELVQQ